MLKYQIPTLCQELCKALCIHHVIHLPLKSYGIIVIISAFKVKSSLRNLKKFVQSHIIYYSERTRIQIQVYLTVIRKVSSQIEYLSYFLLRILSCSHTPQTLKSFDMLVDNTYL